MKKIIKPFDLEAAKNGAKIETRNGKEVEILRTDLKNNFPIIGIVTGDDGSEGFAGWKTDGTSPSKILGDNDNDLVLVEYEDEHEESEDEKMLNNIEECLRSFYKKSEYREIYDWIKEKKEESSRKGCTKSWWIARDEDDELYIYNEEPVRGEYSFYSRSDENCYITLYDNLFPEVTWENSPKKIEMKLAPIKNESKTEKKSMEVG